MEAEGPSDDCVGPASARATAIMTHTTRNSDTNAGVRETFLTGGIWRAVP